MPSRRRRAPCFAIGILMTACGGGPAATTAVSPAASPTATAMTLTSTAIVNGGALPADYTCDGAGSTIALSWSNVPAGTREFALMMTTLPGDGTTKWNWVMYGVPASVTGLAKNSVGIGTLGVGSDGPAAAYQPPCSQGPGPKVYTFTVYALSGSPSFAVPSNQVTGAMLTSAISPMVLASGSLNVSYTRP